MFFRFFKTFFSLSSIGSITWTMWKVNLVPNQNLFELNMKDQSKDVAKVRNSCLKKIGPVHNETAGSINALINYFSLFLKNGDQINYGIITSNGKRHWKTKKKLEQRIFLRFWHCMIEFLQIPLKDWPISLTCLKNLLKFMNPKVRKNTCLKMIEPVFT